MVVVRGQDEARAGRELDLAALVHVDAEAFAEQLKDLLGNLLAGLHEGMDQLLNVSDIQP